MTSAPALTDPVHQGDSAPLGSTLNWLRAAVLGANDGITSVAGLVLGVAALDAANTPAILTAGVAGLVAGAGSMAMGEYVSVSTQRDTERAVIELERRELAEDPEGEFQQLVDYYKGRGLTEPTARSVAEELTAVDPLRAHLDAEYGINPDELTNPTHAAVSSFVAFTIGALMPLLFVLLPPPEWRVPFAFVSVAMALGLTGWLSARLGKAARTRAVVRIVVGGAFAMGLTYLAGSLLGLSGVA